MNAAPTGEALLSCVDGLASADTAARVAALAALVGAGRAATGMLLEALRGAAATAVLTKQGTRALVARALGEIGDPAAADALAALLGDADPAVRGRAAQGLSLAGDPRGLGALAATLDDLPDPLHHPASVATDLLIARGSDALTAVARLLDAPGADTRERAWYMMRSIAAALPPHQARDAPPIGTGFDPRGAPAGQGGRIAAWRGWVERIAARADAVPPGPSQ